jgi:hypothetical protein
MILVPIPETIESVARPVTLDIVRQLMTLSGLSHKTNIAFYGDMERAKQLNSALQSEGIDPNTFAFNDKIELEVSEKYEEDRIMNEALFNPENLLVFNDPALNVVMKPVYAWMETTVTVKYRASNKNQAIKWRDAMKAKISQHMNVLVHDATYAFGIPHSVVDVLRYLHSLRENVAGYGEDFDKYFDDHKLPKMREVTNQSGSQKLWVVPETQTCIQGWFDFEVPDEASKDGDGAAVVTSFNYKYYYHRPTLIVLIYPLMVHNQLIDEQYRKAKVKDHNDVLKSYGMVSRLMLPFESARLSDKQIRDFGYPIPSFDEFQPKSLPIKSRRVITAMIQLDEANPLDLMSLTDFGEYQLTPEIIQYLKDEHEYLVQPGMSAMNVTLYQDSNMIRSDPPSIQIDADLKVTSIEPLNLRTQHHLRLGLLTDWYMLKGNALERLQDHGRAANQMLMAIDPTLLQRGYLPPLIADEYISKISLLIALQNIRPLNAPVGGLARNNTVQFLTVQTSTKDLLTA